VKLYFYYGWSDKPNCRPRIMC